ncbi:BREX-1 system adenine-specific DNA-methyltransferase PglX [Siminovitchia fortis]|nr:BREX-1 system adenine-specific DNA-methyltransferase PglX [Siminovitchia fortis]WHY83728.1 BREX-1 system adenine-specific DNA-methyltransferase PglX [Siminovitchia fortis]
MNGANEKAVRFFNKNRQYYLAQEGLLEIPGFPIAYWLSEKTIKLFQSKKLLKYGKASEEVKTGNNEEFIRNWFEVCLKKIMFDINSVNYKWVPYHKGGEFRKWYGNLDWVINWEKDGKEIKSAENSGFQGRSMYFKGVISWSKVTSRGISIRYLPTNVLFDSGSPSFKSNSDIEYYVMGFLNSVVSYYFLKSINPTLNLQVGNVESLPFIYTEKKDKSIVKLVEACLEISKADWDSFETSWDFKVHPLVEFRQAASRIAEAFANWQAEAERRFQTLKANEEELNRIFIGLYGLEDELTPGVEDKDVTVRRADVLRDVKSFLSYAVGLMFGRYSLDEEGLVFAGGEFDLGRYETFVPDADNVIPIADEMYFEDDIVSRFVDILKIVFGDEHLEDNLDFIADTLTRRANETSRQRIRRYFLKEFYKDHLQIYQKRPIYWLFDSGKQDGFKALVYLHRYEPGLAARVRTDYLHAQQRKYEEEIERMDILLESDVSKQEKTRARKNKEKLQKQLLECQSYDQIIAHVANQKPDLDLDDGVKVNYAKFQNIEIPQGEGKKPLKGNVLAKI